REGDLVAVDLAVGVPAVEVLEERTHADMHGAKGTAARAESQASPRAQGLEDACPELGRSRSDDGISERTLFAPTERPPVETKPAAPQTGIALDQRPTASAFMEDLRWQRRAID
ncbi:MAG TPA: hypothetical protein VKE97_10725, partial [Acidimicrobiia bacterium]|nr:hypothetical protein [Acidimicrobiia bacterium]